MHDNAENAGLTKLTGLLLEDNPLAERLAFGAFKGMGGDLVAKPLSDKLRWTPDRDWMKWDGAVWKSVKEPKAVEVVRDELQRYFTEIVDMLSAEGPVDPKTVQSLSKLLGATKAKNVTYFLKGLLATDSDVWDADPHLLNVQNGVLNLKTGKLTDHDPALFMTKIGAVNYKPDATHDDWEAALKAIPEDIQLWMQVRYGQSITGYAVDDDVLPVQTGGGQNGKSTLVNAILAAIGDYGVSVPEKVLMANPGEHPTELMTLRGARLAVIEETPEGHRLPTKRLKDLLGTPTMTARAMRQDFVSWKTSHSLILNTNYVPQVAETDHGTWRRLALVKFPYKFIHPDEPIMAPNEVHGIPGLRDRIAYNTDDQLEAVLAWLVDGAVAWFENDRAQYPVPLSVQSDTQAWRADADLILAYSMERLTFDSTCVIASNDLYADFSRWLEASGKSGWNNQTFASRFGSHELVEKNHVENKRISLPQFVSRPMTNTLLPTLPAQIKAWTGVRFN